MALVRILVDGYSLLHNWPELAPGRARHSPAARDELIRRLTLYQDAEGTPITIFFDGAGAPAGTPPALSTAEVEVLYSRGGQTADDMIERAAHRLLAYGEVLAVTDDLAERDTVMSLGGMTSSCWNFIRTVEDTLAEAADDLKHHNRRERHRFKQRGVALLIILAALTGRPIGAQTNSGVIVTKPSPTANRFLFIVETSRAMKGRTNGVRSTVQNLLVSEMGGQLQRGDTLGVWTFSDGLHAGQFPLQLWAPQIKPAIIARVTGYLKEQSYDKPAALEKVMPAMDRVIKSSPYITVILVYSGQQPMIGTPFDKQINELHKQWANEESKAHMPFITVLRAKGGTITDFSVTPAPWPVDMPPLPVELINARVESKPPAPTNAVVKAQPRPVPPLIITGKKPAPPPPESAAPTASSNTPPAHPSESSQPLPANGLVAPPIPANQSATIPITPASSPDRGSSTGALPSASAQAGQPTPIAAGQQTAKAESTAPAPNSTEPPASTSTPKGPTPAGAAMAQPVTVAAANPASAPQPSPSRAQPQASTSTAPVAPVPVSQTGSDPGAVNPHPSTVAVAPQGVFGNWIWLVGLAVAAVAAAMVMRTMLRARAAARASLITRSLDRQGK